MCIHKQNAHVLKKTIDFLADLGVGYIKTNPVSNSGAWIAKKHKYDLNQKQLYDLYIDIISHYLKQGSKIGLHLGGFFMCEKESKKFSIPSIKNCNSQNNYVCEHARSNIYIAPNGLLLPCISLSGLNLNWKKTYIPKTPLQNALISSNFFL